MQTVNLGLIGCGAIVQAVHLNTLRRIDAARVVAVAEPHEQRRQQACAIAKARGYADWRQLLDDQEVQAVIIALPTGMHAQAAEAALAARKHVYLEKPLAINVDEGRRVVQAWKNSQCVGMIGFNYRFNPLYAEIKRQILAGRVGQVLCLRSVFSTSDTAMPEWKKSRASGGGVLLDLGSHHIDLMRFMFGEVQAVSARIDSARNEADTASISLRMSGGVRVESFFSLASAVEDCIEVYGQHGKLWADRYRSAAVVLEKSPSGVERLIDSVRNLPAVAIKMSRRGRELSYAASLQTFVDAVRAGTTVAPDFDDGLRCLEVIEAAEKSARRGCEVEIGNV